MGIVFQAPDLDDELLLMMVQSLCNSSSSMLRLKILSNFFLAAL